VQQNLHFCLRVISARKSPRLFFFALLPDSSNHLANIGTQDCKSNKKHRAQSSILVHVIAAAPGTRHRTHTSCTPPASSVIMLLWERKFLTNWWASLPSRYRRPTLQRASTKYIHGRRKLKNKMNQTHGLEALLLVRANTLEYGFLHLSIV